MSLRTPQRPMRSRSPLSMTGRGLPIPEQSSKKVKVNETSVCTTEKLVLPRSPSSPKQRVPIEATPSAEEPARVKALASDAMPHAPIKAPLVREPSPTRVPSFCPAATKTASSKPKMPSQLPVIKRRSEGLGEEHRWPMATGHEAPSALPARECKRQRVSKGRGKSARCQCPYCGEIKQINHLGEHIRIVHGEDFVRQRGRQR